MNTVSNEYAAQFINTSSETVFVNNLTHYEADPSLYHYLVDEGEYSLGSYASHYLIAASFEKGYSRTGDELKVVAHFNNEAYHTPAMSLNMAHNAMLRLLTNRTHTLTAINHPLPRTVKDQVQLTLLSAML